MSHPRLTALALAAVAAATGTAVTLGAHAAAAADAGCTAWSSMPASVAITSRSTVVHARLTGDAGCRAESFENGATATLYGPRGTEPYDQRWSHFGTTQDIEVVVGVTRPGTYTMRNGDVQLYDADERRVPSQWRQTSVTIKYGTALKLTSRAHATVVGRAGHYSSYGWVGSSHVTVRLQVRTASGWRAVSAVRTDGAGRFAVQAPAGRTYRVTTAETARYWGASATFR